MKTFTVAAITLGLLLAIVLVDREPATGLAIYTGLAGLLVGLVALQDRAS